MEITLLDKFDYQQNVTFHSNKFRCSEPRSARLLDTNYENKAGCCKHFTIRGYVAGLRKDDVKICWPFGTLNHDVCDKAVKSLPPLPVINFRRWDCEDCLYKTISANRNVIVDANVEPNNASSHGIDSITSRELGLNNLPDGTSSIGRSPERISGFEAKEPIEGSPPCEGIDYNSEDNHNTQPDEYQFIQNKENEPYLEDELRKEDAESFLDRGGSALVNACADEEVIIDSVQKASNDISQEVPVYECNDTNHAVPSKGDVVNESDNTSIDKNGIHLLEFESGAGITSDSLLVASEQKASSLDNICENQDFSERVEPSNKRDKRIPKMKFLADILRNEEICKPREIDTSNLDAEHVKPGTPNDEPDVSRGNAVCFQEFRYPFSLQRTNIISPQGSKGDKCSENDDEGQFLKNWGKKVSRKLATGQEEAKKKGIANAASDIPADTFGIPQEKCVDLNSEICGNISEIASNLNSGNYKLCEGVRQEPQIAVNFHTRHESVPCNQLKFKIRGLARTGRIQYHGIAQKHGLKHKSISSKNKGKALIVDKERPLKKRRVERDDPLSLNCTYTTPHDSTCPIGSSNANDSKMNGERRSNQEAKKKGIDNAASDIPADSFSIPQVKHVDLNSERCGTISEVATDLNSGNYKVCEGVRQEPHEDTIAVNFHTRHESAPHNQHKFKIRGLARTGRIQHRGITQKQGSKHKGILSKNKGKALTIEKERPLKKRRVEKEDPLSLNCTYTTPRDSSCPIGKTNGEKRSNQEVDDFTMDIVELLARNLHQRRLMHASTATEPLNQVAERKENMEGRDRESLSDSGKIQHVKPVAGMDQGVPQKFQQIGNIGNLSWTISGARRYKNRVRKRQRVLTNAGINKQRLVDPSAHNYSQLTINDPTRNSCGDTIEQQVPGLFQDANGNSINICKRNTRADMVDSQTRGTCQDGKGNYTDINILDPCLTKCSFGVPSTNYTNYIQRPLDSTDCFRKDVEYQSKFSTQDINSEVPTPSVEPDTRELGRHNNDMTATQLLWMFDPAPYSGKLCYRTMDIVNLNRSESDYPKYPLPYFSSSGLNTIATTAGPSQRGNSSKLLRPLPRFGVLGTYLQREIASHSDKCKTPFGSMERTSNLTRPIIGGTTPLENSAFGRTSGTSSIQGVGSIHERSKTKPPDAEIIMHSQHSITTNNGLEIRPVERRCNMELCAVNRNPADFAIISDDCEYMIGYDEPRLRSVTPRVDGKKRQKMMKLTDL